MKKIIPILFLLTSLLMSGQQGTIQIGTNVLNKGAKGEDGSGAGDMEASTYDPTNVAGDAFDMDNMVEGTDTKILTAAERSAIATNTAKVSFPEAPNDGQEYVRKNEAWAVATSGGGGSSNPNIVPVTTEAALYDSGNAGKILEIQSDITLTANRVLADNVTLYFTTGEIIHNGYNLDAGTEGKFYGINPSNQTYFQLDETSQLTGNWIPPKNLYTINFGVRENGVLKLGTGNITASGTTFTDATATFTSADIGKTIAIVGAGANAEVGQPDNYVHTTTIASVTNGTTVELSDAAINTVTDANYVYGNDDFNIVDQAFDMMNRRSGTDLVLGSTGKTISTSTVAVVSNIINPPTNWTIGSGTHGHNVYVVGDIQIFPHDITASHFITSWYTKDSKLIGAGGKILGDYKTALGEPIYTSQNGKTENNHAIVRSSLTIGGIEENLQVYGFYGDGAYGTGDSQFMNSIDGDNKITGATDSTISVGYIDESGVVDAANTDYIYSTDLLPLTGFQFDNITNMGINRFVILTAGSFTNWEGTVNPYYWLLFYDDEGNFLHKSEILQWFQRAEIPNVEYAQARILMKNPDSYGGVTDDIVLNLRPALIPYGGYMRNNIIKYCGRQGLSNGPSDFVIEGNIFDGIGGLSAGPGYGIDYEDGGRIKQNITIKNNRFTNSWGGITIRNAENVIIQGNYFGPQTMDTSSAPTTSYRAGIDASGYNISITDNTVYNSQIIATRRTRWYGNKIKNSIFRYDGEGELIENNLFENTFFVEQGGMQGYNTLFRNNTMRYDLDARLDVFRERNNIAIWENNEFLFNDVSEWNPNVERTDNPLQLSDTKLGETVNHYYSRLTMLEDFGGYWKNNRFKGYIPQEANSGEGYFPIGDYYGDEIDAAMQFQNGLAKDFKMEKMKIHNWIRFDLNQWSGTLSNPNTISIIDTELRIKSDMYAWTNINADLVESDDKNVNLYFKNTSFIIEPNFSGHKLFKLDHLGTTVLEDCVFDMQNTASYNLDLTSTSVVGATGGAITIIDPIFKNGFTVTLRSSDKVVFTKPSPLMATYAQYADDTAAGAAGYPSGYMYVTTTGDMKVKL